MANNIAFQPMGKTYKLTANATAQQLTINADSPVNQYLFVNHESAGTDPVYVRISANVSANVSVPGNGTVNAAYGIPIRPQSMIILTGVQSGPNSTCYITCVTESATAREIYVTPGEGL